MPNDTEQQESSRKKVAGGSVNVAELAEIEAARIQAGYKRLSPFVRDVMLAVSRSEPARVAVLAVVGREDRRKRAA
jgi:hypothetical protein